MAKRSKLKADFRNLVILVLLCIIGFETYLLYKDKKIDFKGVIPSKQIFSKKLDDISTKPVVKKTVKEQKKTVSLPVAPAVTAIKLKPGSSAKIAFVIDDWGYSIKNCHFLKEISSPIAVAILPDLEHSIDVMNCAAENNKEIMLHLPLEPHENSDEYPKDYIINTSMSPTKVDGLLEKILDKMPKVVGVNNHMGSKATEDKDLMHVIFKQLKYRKLFFVDSFVTSGSICRSLAAEMGISFARRDVFLDNKNKHDYIVQQIQLLAKEAEGKGFALAIGHDRELTMQVIKEQIPLLKSQGFEIVTVRELIKLYTQTR